jgi:hypothetical protein
MHDPRSTDPDQQLEPREEVEEAHEHGVIARQQDGELDAGEALDVAALDGFVG